MHDTAPNIAQALADSDLASGVDARNLPV